MRTLERCGLALALLGSVLASPAAAQISLTPEVAYTQDFDTLSSTPVTSTVVPTGWAFFETLSNANTTYTVSIGSSGTGDTYSFGATGSTDRAFGGVASGNLVTNIGARFTNGSTFPITSLSITYHGEQWRAGTANRSDRMDFQYSTTATDLTAPAAAWTDVDVLDCVGPMATATGNNFGNDPTHQVTITGTLTFATPIAPGATFWIRWVDADITGTDDGLGIDDLSLTPHSPSVTPTGSAAFDVYFDANGNGVHDAGEVGIAGWGITLDGTTTQSTAADGTTTFANQMVGAHTIGNTPPAAAGTWSAVFPPVVTVMANTTTTVHVGVTCTCPDDGDLCTDIPTCNAGACPAPTPINCNDTNDCTDDSCSNGICAHANNTNACSDGMLDTRNDVCTAGACVGTPYTCTLGTCEATSMPNGTDCTIVYASPTTLCGGVGTCDHCEGSSNVCVADPCDAGTNDAGMDAGAPPSDAGFDAGNDAAVLADSGMDAGTPPNDAGNDAATVVDANLPDTGVHDAGSDGGARDAGAGDGSSHADAGHTPPTAVANCGCSTSGPRAPSMLGLALLGLALFVRRSRR